MMNRFETHQQFTQAFFDDLQPMSVLEEQLVQNIASTSWLLNRLRARRIEMLNPQWLTEQIEQIKVLADLSRQECSSEH